MFYSNSKKYHVGLSVRNLLQWYMVDQRPSGSVTETDSGSHARIYVQIMLHNDAHCDPNIVAQMDAHYDLLQGQTPPISLSTFDLSHYLEKPNLSNHCQYICFQYFRGGFPTRVV